MSKKKWYAIKYLDKDNRITNSDIVNDWNKCKSLIKYNRCKFKGFARYEDAENWIKGKINNGIYIDGSFNKATGIASWACVAIKDNQIIEIYAGAVPKGIKMESVGGELYATGVALKMYPKFNLPIYYDYEGIGKLISGEYKPRKKEIRDWLNSIKDTLEKMEEKPPMYHVSSHSGNEGNAVADKAARLVLNKI